MRDDRSDGFKQGHQVFFLFALTTLDQTSDKQ